MSGFFRGIKMTARKKIIRDLIIFAVIGFGYFVFMNLTGLSLKCPLYFVTKGKIKCHGCGITRMCTKLIFGDFCGAFYANPCLFIFLPIWAALIFVRIVFEPEGLKCGGKLYNFCVYFSLITLLVFGVLRNIFKW